MKINKISPNLAQEIVNAAKEVVNKDINFIDKNGIIIASTDEKRINKFHEAGYKAINTLTNIIVEDNSEYKGSKSGINYPIKINNEAIGAIGITGEPNKISKYGFLVTKITEVFIKEQQLSYKYESDKKRINYVVKSLVYNYIEDKVEIENIMKEFKISVNQRFAVVVMQINKNCKMKYVEAIENDITKVFNNIGNIFKIYIYPNEFIALINEKRYEKLKQVYMDILLKYKGSLSGGVGRLKDFYSADKSYKEARVALKYSTKHNKILTYIDDLDLELILENIDNDIKKQYIDKILRLLDEQEIKLLEIYYNNNMSLKQTAYDLYIHKNTLQYRLEKIYNKCNLNPRIFNDSVILYLAIVIKLSI